MRAESLQFLNGNCQQPSSPTVRKTLPPVPLFSDNSSPLRTIVGAFSSRERVIAVSTLETNPALSIAVAETKRKILDPLVPWDHVPDMDEFLGLLTSSIDLCMAHSFGNEFWSSDAAGTWKMIREEASVSIESAIKHQTELTIFQACCDLLLAPSRLLAYLDYKRPSFSTEKPSETSDATTKAAADAIKRGQPSKALRILTGTGAAPHTLAQLVRTAVCSQTLKSLYLFIARIVCLPLIRPPLASSSPSS
jgi:hypothetical protein